MTKARTTNATEIPGLGKPPGDISPALRRYLESISEALQIRLGQRGDARDRAVTFRELLDSGLAIELGSNPYQIGKPPADPDPDPPANGTPTAPTNFSANGGYSIVTCFWDYPNYGPHSHTEIWRHTSNVIGNAQLVGISSGISFIDPVGQSKTYYYWARHVSTYDIAGPFHSANGDEAVTAADVDALLTVLTGAITESQLFNTLGERINLIDASALVTNSVAWRVAQEATARAAAIALLDDAMEYNNATAYKKGDIVVYNANLYEAKSSTTGNLPTNTTFWTLLGSYTSIGDIVKNNGSKIVEINTVTSDSTSAAAQAIVGLKSTVENPTTGVVATSTALGALTTRVSTAEGNIVSNSSSITSLSNAVNHPTTGLATRASSTALSALDSRVTAAEGVNTSQSTSITSLQNTIDHPTTGLATRASSTALSALDSRVTAAEGVNTSQSTSITSLQNTIDHPATGLATRASSTALSALDSRVTSAEGTITAQGSSITALQSTVNNATTGVVATANAVSLLNTEIFPNGTAQASYIDQVNATVGANTAAIQAEATTRATADGTLFGQFTVKVDLNGHVSGFGLASTLNNAAPSSEFIVRADRFSIASPGQATIVPFIVQATATTINGVAVPAGVYISDAFIRNGTITKAKIGIGEIDNANIASLNADKITAGSIDTARLTIDNVTLDSVYDPSIGRNRLKIRDLGVDAAQINTAAIKTAKIDDLAVSTIKIAGNAITQPEVYTANDVYIPTASAIMLTNSGVNESYNFVGSHNGDYEYQFLYFDENGIPIYDFVFVGAGNGDHVRVITYTAPTFANAITVIETPTVTVGVDATAAVQIVYYATHDGSISTFNDSGQHLFMLLDTGVGYRLVAQQQVGLRTDSGADTMASLPIAMTFTARNITTARIKILTGSRRVDLSMGNGSNPCWLRNSTISLLGAKR